MAYKKKSTNPFRQIILLVLIIASGLWAYNKYKGNGASQIRKDFDDKIVQVKSQVSDNVDKLGQVADKQIKLSRESRESRESKQTDKGAQAPEYNYTLAPGFAYPKADKRFEIVRHTAFTLAYDERYEQAAWVAYTLTPDNFSTSIKRKENFEPDPNVRTGSASLADYRGSGYDRGHLCPAGDMKLSNQTMDESFLMSNISPQTPSFNRGIWRMLEEKVRKWGKVNKKLYITTGPVLDGSLRLIGPNEVAVPKQYYKVILDLQQPQIKAIAFLMENEDSDQDLQDFVISIDRLEQITGLDFYPLLPDELENQLESNIYTDLWFAGSGPRKH